MSTSTAQRVRRLDGRATLVWLLAGVAALAACGGGNGTGDASDTVNAMDTMGPADVATDTSDAAVDRVQPDVQMRIQCTTSDPGEGSFCDTDGLDCVYGRGDDFGCRRSYRCMNTRWGLHSLGFACMTGATCPAAAPTGTMTSCAAMNQGCTYADGTFCVCTACDPCMADAGMCTGNAVWRCSPPRGDGSCPRPVPNLGTICITDAQECHYGPAGAGYSVRCVNGHWEQIPSRCM